MLWVVFLCGVFAWGVPGESVRVQRVVDGDTLRVVYGGRSCAVRLLGVDAPEVHDNPKLHRDSRENPERMATLLLEGRVAKRWVETQLAPGDTVYLVFDVERHDAYGRLLAYVYLSDGRLLNRELIERGYARWMIIRPNVHFPGR
jgi:micrococcal nuclease